MKLTAHTENENHEITLARVGERLIAEVDERNYELLAREVENGLYLFVHDGNAYECIVDSNRARGDVITVNVRNRRYVTTIGDPRRLARGDASSVHVGDGSAQITSPMPGKVVRVLVEEGARVKAGDGIIVVEAMKMQNELKARLDGVVAEIRAVKGATVDAGDVLVIIDPVTD